MVSMIRIMVFGGIYIGVLIFMETTAKGPRTKSYQIIRFQGPNTIKIIVFAP